MNLRLRRTVMVSASLAALGIFAMALAAQNPGAPAQSTIDLSHAAGAPNGLPIWAYPVNPPIGRGRGAAAGAAAPGGAVAAPPAAAPAGAGATPGGAPPGAAAARGPAPDDGTLMHVPGSTAGYTKTYIANLFTVPDWFPASHPPMPDVVATGNKDRWCASVRILPPAKRPGPPRESKRRWASRRIHFAAVIRLQVRPAKKFGAQNGFGRLHGPDRQSYWR